MTKEQYTPWNIADILDSDEAMVAYLNAALEENDLHYFVKALGNVARAKGMTAIAADSGLGRQALYRALSAKETRVSTLCFASLTPSTSASRLGNRFHLSTPS